MSNSIVKKKTVLKRWVKISIIALVILIFMLGIFIILKGSQLVQVNNTVTPIYDYNINQKLDYKVYLNKNSFIDKEYLGMNETYIADLIKDIEINFIYNFQGDSNIPLKYSYEVLASTKGEYSLEVGEKKKEVWNKDRILLEKIEKEVDSNQFLINEKVSINFLEYSDEVKQFRKELNLPITAFLNIIVRIHVDGELSVPFENEQTITLKIPLSDQAFKITDSYEKSIEEHVYEKAEYQAEVENKNLVSGMILIIISIFILVIFFKEIFNIQKKTNYSLKLNKILKSYGDIIIEIATPMDITSRQVIDVKNFNEMIDLEEELRIPINFYETIKLYEGEFYILHGDIVYRYILTDNDSKN